VSTFCVISQTGETGNALRRNGQIQISKRHTHPKIKIAARSAAKPVKNHCLADIADGKCRQIKQTNNRKIRRFSVLVVISHDLNNIFGTEPNEHQLKRNEFKKGMVGMDHQSCFMVSNASISSSGGSTSSKCLDVNNCIATSISSAELISSPMNKSHGTRPTSLIIGQPEEYCPFCSRHAQLGQLLQGLPTTCLSSDEISTRLVCVPPIQRNLTTHASETRIR